LINDRVYCRINSSEQYSLLFILTFALYIPDVSAGRGICTLLLFARKCFSKTFLPRKSNITIDAGIPDEEAAGRVILIWYLFLAAAINSIAFVCR
jgi:hypothetical protein